MQGQETLILKYRMPNQGHKRKNKGNGQVQGSGSGRNKIMREQGEAKRGETGVFIYTKNPFLQYPDYQSFHLGLMQVLIQGSG